MLSLQTLYFYFMNTQFIFEQVADDKLLSQMSAKSKQDFPFDIR